MSRPPRETEGDFLSRWSRLKREGQVEPEPEPAAGPPAGAEEPEKSEAEILEELGLPDPETLGPGSDFKAFMAEAVPDFIRRKALRRLWASNPALANLDMLVDYGEDYTDRATVVANLQSAYKAGRGYFDKLAREAEKAEAAKAETSEQPAATADAEAGADSADPATADEAPEAGETHRTAEAERSDEIASEEADQTDPAPVEDVSAGAHRRRRVRFNFDES